MRLAAHGKVFLAGEYAVLDGAPALVVGIDKDLHASCEPAPKLQILRAGLLWDGGPPPEELRFAARAAQLCGASYRLIYEDDLQKGLGSSAAASVIAVRAAGNRSDDEVIALAAAAHWAEQGGAGSGADVAASALGGVLEVRARIPWRSPEEVMSLPVDSVQNSRPLEFRRVKTPPDLRLLLAFTGREANTRKLVREVRAFAEGDPRRWAVRAADISAASTALRDALESGDGEAALGAVRRGAAAMAALGEQVGAPIVTEELARACALAASAGAAAKPSGAGGGDCAVVVAFGDEALQMAENALRPHFSVLRVSPA